LFYGRSRAAVRKKFAVRFTRSGAGVVRARAAPLDDRPALFNVYLAVARVE